MSNASVKNEFSPAISLSHSFVSTPGTYHSPLFDVDDGRDIRRSSSKSSMFDDEVLFDESRPETPAPEKKTVKKRKSWGQQLPEPKTNLPPRKRAKTEDEKEQRRVERVLRNRRAAQSSRERKRLEVEELEAQKQQIERESRDLAMRLANVEAENARLREQIAQFTGNMTAFSPPTPQSLPEQIRPSPVTLTPQLFGSLDTHSSHFLQPIADTRPHFQATIQTVDPASLSPEIRPVSESSNARSSDMTQHPAAMLCDLQCQSEEQRPWMTTTNPSISVMATILMLASITSSTFLSPLSQIMNSLRTRSSLLPTTSVLTLIIWLATTPTTLTSTSTISSTMPKTHTLLHKRFNLRMNLLRRLLACSPQLARPLMDATMGALRSVSEQQTLARAGLRDSTDMSDPHQGPSFECLMALLWAIKVIDREHRKDQARRRKGEELQEARQASQEDLEELFRVRAVKHIPYVGEEDWIGRGV